MNADERRFETKVHRATGESSAAPDRHTNPSKSMSKSRTHDGSSNLAPTHALAPNRLSYRSIRVHLRLSAALFLLVAGTARAANPPEVSMDVDIGFNSAYRMGAWTPLYVTIASRTPRAVRIEVNFPHDQTAAMKIVQQVSATPTPATYMLLAPATFYDVTLLSISIIDARSNRRLAIYEPQNAPNTRAPPRAVSGGELFVVYAGEAPVPRVDLGELAMGALQVGSIDGNRLPASPIGYESIDVLMLGAIDFARLDGAVQQAIADYVVAGGTLVCWPADGPLPPDSPLTKLLPADVGSADTVEFSPSQLEAMGFGSRFGKTGWRILEPHDDANVFYAAANVIPCYVAPRGHGKVILLPLRANQLQFTSETANQKFWRDIFTVATSKERIQLHNKDQGRAFYNNYQQDSAVAASADFVMNLLGDVPGIDRFGFGYVAWIMVGLMVIVGPVDWFLLKWTRRQPWTIATTAGWIALVTLAAIYIGHLVRSGDLHFRTLRLVDQIDHRVVSNTHVAAVYSPNTNRYDFETPPDSWWRPLSSQMYYYGSSGMKADFAFHQSQSRNEPLPLRIPIWNIRFLRGDDYTTAPPMLAAELRLTKKGGTHQLRGSVTNLCDHPLLDVWFMYRDGTALIASLAAGETRTIDELLTIAAPSNIDQRLQYNTYYGYGQSWTEEAMKLSVNQYQHTFGLLRSRDREIPPPALNPDMITVFAAADIDHPSVKLLDAKPLQRHRTLIRAVVPVQKETPSTQPQ